MKQGLALLVAALCAGWAHAKEGDTLRPFVSATLSHDSNILRLDRGENAFVGGVLIQNPERADVLKTVSAGVNLDWTYGRQRVLGLVSANENRFTRYSNLDYDGNDLRLNWSWVLGNRLQGNLVTSRQTTQTSFSDLLFGGVFGPIPRIVNNQLTRIRYSGAGEWTFHPRWRVGAGFGYGTTENSDFSQAVFNTRDKSVDLRLSYLTPRGTRVSGQLLRRGVRYDRSRSNYDQTELNLSGDWRVTGKLAARSSVGVVDRTYPNSPNGDFTGVTLRASADYFPTGKTAVSASLGREFDGGELQNATFRLNASAGLNAVWRPSRHYSLTAGFRYDDRDYGDTAAQIGSGNRGNERDYVLSLGFSYTPVDELLFDVGVLRGRREADSQNSGYDYLTSYLSLRADF